MSSSSWASRQRPSGSGERRGTPLVGGHVVVLGSHTSYAGIAGTVVDETMRTVVIRTPTGDRRVPKQGCVFAVDGVELVGREVEHRPEERLKRTRKPWRKKQSFREGRRS